MQLAGTQFTRTAAVFGNDVSTLPDFPAEIRAPAGTLPGVSGFQIRFSSSDIYTPGDEPDVLVAMNPAALKDEPRGPAGGRHPDRQRGRLHRGPTCPRPATRANPLEDGSLKSYTVFEVPISTLNARALEGLGHDLQAGRPAKNFFALGLIFWLYEREHGPDARRGSTRSSASGRSSPRPTSGPSRPATTTARRPRCSTPTTGSRRPSSPPGTYRNITGNEATALGFVAAARLAGRTLFYGSYPITPASDILHELSSYKNFGVQTFQAEDEIAAIGAAIGASFGGAPGRDRHVRARASPSRARPWAWP